VGGCARALLIKEKERSDKSAETNAAQGLLALSELVGFLLSVLLTSPEEESKRWSEVKLQKSG
jgi:hypothetical protein